MSLVWSPTLLSKLPMSRHRPARRIATGGESLALSPMALCIFLCNIHSPPCIVLPTRGPYTRTVKQPQLIACVDETLSLGRHPSIRPTCLPRLPNATLRPALPQGRPSASTDVEPWPCFNNAQGYPSRGWTSSSGRGTTGKPWSPKRQQQRRGG